MKTITVISSLKVNNHLRTFSPPNQTYGLVVHSGLVRWNKRLEPKLKREKPATKVDMKRLEQDVKKSPDAYQYERAERFGVAQSTIYYALIRLGISVKKNANSPQSKRSKKVSFSKKNKAV
jgi:transposase